MSNYYQYEFISPSQVYAIIKEELKSYFDTGVIDDLLFPIWTEKCLKKLGKGSYNIDEVVLFLDGYKATLPPDFAYVREAWVCTAHTSSPFRLPGAFYQSVTSKLDEAGKSVNTCNSTCDPCTPDAVTVYYKTTTEMSYNTYKSHLLKPGNISAKDSCDVTSPNLISSSFDTFDIRGGKFLTNFSSGDVYLKYYAKLLDEEGNVMIPDDYRIKEYIEAFIKAKLYELLWNTITDETANQIAGKMQYYMNKADEAYIMADNENKKDTIYKSIDRMRSRLNSANKYKIL